MLAKCDRCDAQFDSHDGGTVKDGVTLCPKCEAKIVEVINNRTSITGLSDDQIIDVITGIIKESDVDQLCTIAGFITGAEIEYDLETESYTVIPKDGEYAGAFDELKKG